MKFNLDELVEIREALAARLEAAREDNDFGCNEKACARALNKFELIMVDCEATSGAKK